MCDCVGNLNIKVEINKKASIRWQDSAPPISGYTGYPRYEAKCMQRRCFKWELIDIRLIVKAVSTQLYIGHNINNNSRLRHDD